MLALALTASIYGVSGCGGGGGDNTRGSLVYGDERGIVERTIAGGDERILVVAPSPTTVLRDPTISPSGQLAYVQTATVRVGAGPRVTNSDVYVANRDGSNSRLVFAHQADNQTMSHPQWVSDAAIVLLVHTLVSPSDPRSVDSELFQVDLSTGVPRQLREGVTGIGVASDGNRIALVTDGGEVIASRLDNPQARIMLTTGSAQQLVFIGAPRYSADGLRIAFTAFDADTFPPRDESTATKAAVWVAPSSGGELRRVADFPASDRAALAWSDDGRYLYVLASSGLLQVDAESGGVRTLRENANVFSAIDWRPPPAEDEGDP
jgi:Tol biopolymer transport system component